MTESVLALTSPLSKERIATVDVLRGFALFGILYAHMIFWYSGGPLPEYLYSAYNKDIPSMITMGVLGLFVMSKFFSLFSFLFGLSFYIQIQSLMKNNDNVVKRFGWRLFILGIIGVLHHIFWRGDILSIYVPLGFILIFARNLSNKTILIIGAICVLNIPTKIMELASILIQNKIEILPFDFQTASAAYYKTIADSNLSAILFSNLHAFGEKFTYQINSGRLFITFGFFLLGMYVGRMKWFEKLDESYPLFKLFWKKIGFSLLAIIGIGIVAGIIIGALSIDMHNNFWAIWAGGFFVEAFNSGVTLFYIASITLLMRKEMWQRRLAPLANVGKMALTSYLTQTAVGLTLFYSIGFGMFPNTSPAFNIVMCIIVFFIQIQFSRVWLTHFNYGPVEWIWRSATFFKWQPFLKK